MKTKDIPLLTSRIEAFPVLMFSWNCPKCGTFHFKVNRTKHNGEELVACLNKKCGEFFDRSQFRFQFEDQIARIMAEKGDQMNQDTMKDMETELMKGELADAVTA